MFTFDATISGTTANAYTSLSEADDYFTGHLEGDQWWSPLTDAKKQAALVQATYRLEQEQYGGDKTVAEQRLQWPRLRIIVRQSDSEYLVGEYYRPSDEMPQELQFATYETALAYIKRTAGEYTMDDDDLETMNSLSIGPLNMSMRQHVKADRLQSKVERFLKAIGPNGWISKRNVKFVL